MLNKEQSDILSTLDNLFELSEDNTTKKAIIEASKTFINHINMATQEQNKIGIWAILAPVLTELGKEGIEWLEGKLADHKAALQSNDVHPCPQGQIWSDLQQKCVPDIG